MQITKTAEIRIRIDGGGQTFGYAFDIDFDKAVAADPSLAKAIDSAVNETIATIANIGTDPK